MTTYSSQQIASIILGIEKGDLPLKYAYMTESGSKARNTLEEMRTQSGQSFSDATLLKNTIELYLQELGVDSEVVIFDFGCGTGETIQPTLKKLQSLGITIHYHAFDISENIIDLCRKNLEGWEGVNFDFSVIDFEISNLVSILHNVRLKYDNAPVLGLLLGNTIGNFTSMERVLSNIMEALRLKDRLVIGAERANIQNQKWHDTMIESYNSDKVSNVVLATLLELGIDIKKGSYYSTFNSTTKLIEMFWRLNQDTSITINATSINFHNGERIRVGMSQKLDEQKLAQILTDLDLRIANIRTNTSNSYLQVLVGSKRK